MKIIVAEKPSVSKLIANALKDSDYQYFSVAGHISKIEYAQSGGLPWAKVNLNDLITEDYKYTYEKSFALKDLIKIKKHTVVEELILALDPDIEGYNIQNTVVNYLKNERLVVLKQINVVCLEELSKKGIVKAFAEKTNYDEIKGYPGDLRMRLDFLFGTVLTRKASFDFQKEKKFWSTYNTGRVQTPTLATLINRETEIKNFIPSKYGVLLLKHELLKNPLVLEKILPEQLPIDVFNTQVSFIGTKKKIVQPRTGLNTDDLLKLLSKDHAVFKKITPQTTKLLSNMYLKGLISYPRVENRKYNNHLELLNTFGELYEKETKLTPVVPVLQPENTVTDHGPITPLVLPDVNAHDPQETKVLKSLYRYGKSIFSGSNTYLVYAYAVDTAYGAFKFNVIKDLVVNYDDGTLYESDFEPAKFKTVTLYAEEKETKPKPYYTSVELIKDMTRKKLGTKSTKAQIIQNLVDNKYVYYDSKGKMKSTEKGRAIIKYWQSTFEEITDSKLTAEIEDLFKTLDTYELLLEKEKNYRLYIKQKILDEKTTCDTLRPFINS